MENGGGVNSSPLPESRARRKRREGELEERKDDG
jgi:hypothetical protein